VGARRAALRGATVDAMIVWHIPYVARDPAIGLVYRSRGRGGARAELLDAAITGEHDVVVNRWWPWAVQPVPHRPGPRAPTSSSSARGAEAALTGLLLGS
jgi:hypothetical protein